MTIIGIEFPHKFTKTLLSVQAAEKEAQAGLKNAAASQKSQEIPSPEVELTEEELAELEESVKFQ